MKSKCLDSLFPVINMRAVYSLPAQIQDILFDYTYRLDNFSVQKMLRLYL